MSTDAPTADLPATCPSCGAVVRQSVPWCLQCYASLRPEPEAEPGPEPGAPPTPRADVDAIAERMLAELRASQPRTAGWPARVPSSRAGRAGVVALCIGGLGLVLVLVLTVLGHLL
jgi:hypothetical protein